MNATSQLAKMEQVLTQKGEDGAFVYTDTEVRDFMAVCVFQLGLPTDEHLEEMLLSLYNDMNIEGDFDDDEVAAAAERYFQAHPLRPELLAAFAAMGGDALASSTEALGKSAREFVALRGDVSTRGGPLANPVPTARVKPKRGLQK